MIVDNIKNHELYCSINKNFKEIFEYLKNADKNDGKIIIDEGNVWTSIVELDVSTESKTEYEAHRDFLDIHYIVEGEEVFGFANTDSLTVTKEYNAEKDCEFLEGGINSVTLKKGDFCIVYPQDAHIPGMLVNKKLVKVVAKIRVK